MLNRVTIDCTGMANSRAASTNPAGRDLLEMCKKVIEHFSRSTRGKVRNKLACKHANY